MGALPRWVLTHTATVEPYEGQSGTGPVYGPAEVHRCLVDYRRELVRSGDGREVRSDAQLFLPAGTDVPPESRVTVDGWAATAVRVLNRDGGGLPTPDHVHVYLG